MIAFILLFIGIFAFCLFGALHSRQEPTDEARRIFHLDWHTDKYSIY